MMKPKNSADVILLLYAKAKELGLKASVETSMIRRSDSRYLIIDPGMPREVVVRVSSHIPTEHRYHLNLDVTNPNNLQAAVDSGRKWLETYYGANRQGPPPTPRDWTKNAVVHHRRRGGSGHLLSRELGDTPGDDTGRKDRAKPRRPRGVRGTDPKSKWTSGEARRVRDEWDWDD